jgi:aspartyl aminopeptidase
MCAVADVAHSIKHYQSVFENFGTLDKTLVVDGKIGHMCRPCD